MKVIVGVTTTKARLGIFFYSLQSLRRQSLRDFTIVVSLSSEPYLFDEGIGDVPDWMTGDKVQVEFVRNTGSYRKLLPQILKISEDDVFVTADDDVIYPEDWLPRLVSRATENPGVIVCCRARVIKKNFLGKFQNYSNWFVCPESTNSLDLLPLCGAGAVFRKSLLDLNFLSDEAYLSCAPTSDDMWFRIASIRKNTGVYVDTTIDRANGYIRHSQGLERVNLYRLGWGGHLFMQLVVRVANKFRNYFGIPLCENDLAWARSLKYSQSKKYGRG